MDSGNSVNNFIRILRAFGLLTNDASFLLYGCGCIGTTVFALKRHLYSNYGVECDAFPSSNLDNIYDVVFIPKDYFSVRTFLESISRLRRFGILVVEDLDDCPVTCDLVGKYEGYVVYKRK